MNKIKCIKCGISVEDVPYVPQCAMGGNHEFPVSDSSMPEQNNWKESEEWLNYWKLISVDIDREVADEIEKYISSLLSSQAHALKEQMKACVPEEKEDQGTYCGCDGECFGACNKSFNSCREQTLSAIESIEI